jgi:hypothetical protein
MAAEFAAHRAAKAFSREAVESGGQRNNFKVCLH